MPYRSEQDAKIAALEEENWKLRSRSEKLGAIEERERDKWSRYWWHARRFLAVAAALLCAVAAVAAGTAWAFNAVILHAIVISVDVTLGLLGLLTVVAAYAAFLD